MEDFETSCVNNTWKEARMKTEIMSVLMLVLVCLYGCQSSTSSRRGGGMTKDVGFKIEVPTFDTEIKQGQTKYVTVSLERGDFFKQDVKLKIETSAGLSVNKTDIMIKASDKPDVQFTIAADQNVALGKYLVSVRGVPETGESTSTILTVNVVSP